MFKKIILTLALNLGLALTASQASAQTTPGAAIPPEVLEAFKKEAPLAQKDIDAYVSLMEAAGKNANNPDAMEKLAAKSGLSETRLGLIGLKIGVGMGKANGVTAAQMGLGGMPESVLPTDAEVELVKKNMEKIQAATLKMMQDSQAPEKK